MTKFVILTTQRSGSTVLTRTLDEHPEIFSAGEIFLETKAGVHHPEWHFPAWSIVGKKQSKLNKVVNYVNLKLNAVKHIKAFYADEQEANAKGFKLMYSHIKSAPFIWDYIKSNDIKVIVLIRENVFRMALSRYKMSKTGIAHSNNGVQSRKITVPVQPLLQETLRLEQVNKKILELSANTNRILIYYRDFNEWNTLLQRIFTFLNVSMAALPPVLKKVSADNWQDDIENSAAIETALKANHLEKYIEGQVV
jgi:hypothetical protein